MNRVRRKDSWRKEFPPAGLTFRMRQKWWAGWISWSPITRTPPDWSPFLGYRLAIRRTSAPRLTSPELTPAPRSALALQCPTPRSSVDLSSVSVGSMQNSNSHMVCVVLVHNVWGNSNSVNCWHKPRYECELSAWVSKRLVVSGHWHHDTT